MAQLYHNKTLPMRREIFFFVMEWARNEDVFSKYPKKLKKEMKYQPGLSN